MLEWGLMEFHRRDGEILAATCGDEHEIILIGQWIAPTIPGTPNRMGGNDPSVIGVGCRGGLGPFTEVPGPDRRPRASTELFLIPFLRAYLRGEMETLSALEHSHGRDCASGVTPTGRLAERLHRGDLVAIIFVFALSRALWLVVLYAGQWRFPNSFCQWDCRAYLGIIEYGYMVEPYTGDKRWAGQANWAFFPLYPLLVWSVHAVARLSPLAAGMLVSNGAILAGVHIGCRYLRSTRLDQSVAPFVILVLAGPYSFYFSSVYTEALFFLLTCAAFLQWSNDRPIRASAVGFFLSMTRLVGVFMVVAFAVDLLGRYRLKAPLVVLRRPEIIVAGLLAPAGLFVYMAYLYHHVGDAFAFGHVEVAWGRSPGNPLGYLLHALGHPDIGNLLHGHLSNFYNACWGAAGLFLLGWLARHGRSMETTFGFLCLVLPLSSELDRLPRFVVGCPVFVFAATDILSRMKMTRPTAALLLGCMVAVDVIMLVAWFNGAVFLT
jgi:hypothetical protein